MGANAQTSVPTFTASQVLTAQQMNDSARTGVPVAATTVTRDALFGGSGEKVLAEGQLCYVEGTAGGLQMYDGSAWINLGTGKWQTWTPTYVNLTPGNGTVTSRYIQIGKFVYCWYRLVFGSTSVIANAPRISIPVTASGVTTEHIQCGLATLTDSGTTNYYGPVTFQNNSTIIVQTFNVAGTYPTLATVTATVPMTWTTNDDLAAFWFYEAA